MQYLRKMRITLHFSVQEVILIDKFHLIPHYFHKSRYNDMDYPRYYYFVVAFVTVGLFIPMKSESQQIIHIENRRIAEVRDGFSGALDLQANYVQSKNTIFQTFNSLQTQYKSGEHTVLFLASYNLGLVSDKKVINDSYQHLRYTRSLLPFLAFEMFLQSQHNEGIQLAWRGLAGAGPRFTLIRTDNVRLFLGTLYMYEHERERDSDITYREHRLSSYLSLGVPIADAVFFDVIMYYQPNLQRFASYKYSSQASLEVRLNERFALVSGFSMTHNTRPPEGIQRTYINLRNGVRITF